jgi:hypothetical protein
MTKLIIALRNFPKVPKIVYEAFLLIVCGHYNRRLIDKYQLFWKKILPPSLEYTEQQITPFRILEEFVLYVYFK